MLSDLPVETLAQLSQRITERSFVRGELVTKMGDPADALYFLLEGRLKVVDFTVDGREVGLYFIESNDYFSELSLIDGLPRSEFVIAVSRARVARLARALVISTPRITERVTTHLTRRLRAVSARRTLIGLSNPGQRVCAQLVQLSVKVPDGKVVIAPPLSHHEIAIMINTSREAVTRVFQVLQARGIVKRESGRLRVNNTRYLYDVAEGRTELPKVS